MNRVNNSQRGFTLVEMMIAIVVLAVLMAVVVPSFQTSIKNNRRFSQVNELHLNLMRARSEALARVQRVTVCASSDQASCGGAWEEGWIVFAEDVDATEGVFDPNEDLLLHVQQGLTGGNTMRGSADLAEYVSYVGTGFTQLTDGSAQVGAIVLCDDRGFDDARAVVVNAAGQARIIPAGEQSHISACDPNAP